MLSLAGRRRVGRESTFADPWSTEQLRRKCRNVLDCLNQPRALVKVQLCAAGRPRAAAGETHGAQSI